MEHCPSIEPAGQDALKTFDSLVDVSIVSYRHRNVDSDGVCEKYVIDSLVSYGLLADDSPQYVRWVCKRTVVINKTTPEYSEIVVKEV